MGAPRLPALTVGDALPEVTRGVTQERLNAYAAASGDFNPLHLDAAFAAATQFGGVIAHGMLTLAFVAEALTAAFGAAWLESGSLRARFKGAAYLGDQVTVSGQVTKAEVEPACRLVSCAVAARNQRGEELVSAAATVKLPL